MNEIMATEDMEHINADRDIDHLMRKRESEAQQKVDDCVKAEAARYSMHMKRLRSFYHRASHFVLVCVGAGLATALFTLLKGDIWSFATAVLCVGATQWLARVLDSLSKRRED